MRLMRCARRSWARSLFAPLAEKNVDDVLCIEPSGGVAHEERVPERPRMVFAPPLVDVLARLATIEERGELIRRIAQIFNSHGPS